MGGVDTDVVARFDAVLALGALIGAASLAGAIVLAPRRPAAAAVVRAVAPLRFALAALVATTATLGSLWFSEVAGFRPCELCWYQRIAMYPLVAVLGIAAWRPTADDRGTQLVATVLAGGGAVLAGYQVWLQRFAGPGTGGCDPSAPCTAIYVEPFGLFTIPTMALCGFLAILVLTWTPSRPPGRDDHDTAPHDSALVRSV